MQSQMVAGQWYEVAVDHPANSGKRAAAHFDAASDVLELYAAKSGARTSLPNLRVMVECVEYGDL